MKVWSAIGVGGKSRKFAQTKVAERQEIPLPNKIFNRRPQ
jgi:hypothetical protein